MTSRRGFGTTFRRTATAAGLLLAASTLPSPAAVPRRALVDRREPAPTRLLERGLDEVSRSLAAAFGLEIGAGPEAVPTGRARVRRARLEGPSSRCLQLALAPRHHATGGVLPSPTGLMVLEADLYFSHDSSLSEGSLLVLAEGGREAGVTLLEREFGRPAFRAVLPGDGDLVLGWRAGRSLAMARVTDLDVMHLTVAADDPDDPLAGPSALLFEGLAEYARRRAARGPSAELEIEVRQLLDWVEQARMMIRSP